MNKKWKFQKKAVVLNFENKKEVEIIIFFKNKTKNFIRIVIYIKKKIVDIEKNVDLFHLISVILYYCSY